MSKNKNNIYLHKVDESTICFLGVGTSNIMKTKHLILLLSLCYRELRIKIIKLDVIDDQHKLFKRDKLMQILCLLN